MIQLDEISKIGFGTYRVSIQSKENADALTCAIQHGCNLIDTASNYGNGDSERLVGAVLEQVDKEAFVITKAGYISGNNLLVLQTLNASGKGLQDIVNIRDDFKHSIHPEYLQAQIEVSLERLKRKYIDGFLIHSPEYFFKQNEDSKAYYARIKKAFEFLEEKCQEGIIRYYGVSSNTLPTAMAADATDVVQLLKCAWEVSSTHHFKLIQFPFNIAEQTALAPYSETLEKSLISIAKENGLVTFSNRPFNANTSMGLLRLTMHEFDESDYDIAADDTVGKQCFDLIEKQLAKIDDESKLSDFPVLTFLKDNWMNLSNDDAFRRAFYENLYPFLNVIYDTDIPANHLNMFEKLESNALKYYKKNSTMKVLNFLKSNNLDKLLPMSKGNSLTVNLCSEYLKSGIDHVLVGMTNQLYVEDLKILFK